MIQIYSKGNTDYSANGDSVLFPRSCTVTAELNGTWKMEMIHPRDQERRWKYIEEECVISAPTFMGDRQLFRIREIEKTDGEVTVTALPVFLDSEDDCFLMDVRPTAKNGQEALDLMMSGSPYHGESNITTAATAYFVERNLPSAINGTESPTFVERWGGEILYDNYKVIINERAGGDYGVEVRYGKNMEGIDHTLDMSGVVTRIIPVAYNGNKMSGSTPWVDSPNIGKYEKKYIRKIKFDDVKMREDAQEDDEENGITICDTQEELKAALSARCKKAFDSGIDLPAISIDVYMIELSKTEEYKNFNLLEKVGLGDDIRCRHKELGITTKERVIAVTWDCCRNRVEKLTLGESLYDYFSSTNSSLDSILGSVGGVIGDDGSVMAEKIKGFLDATRTQLRLQNSVAKKQIVRAILFEDLDPDSELYGAMALGTQGLQISKKRTADNRDWDWATAMTANGIIANYILTGILSDKKGLNTWNLDTGEMNMKVLSIVADKFSLSSGGTIEEIAKGEAKNIVKELTQEDIFNMLFCPNGVKIDGVELRNGKIYISATYIDVGEMSANRIRGGELAIGGAEDGIVLNGKRLSFLMDGEEYGFIVPYQGTGSSKESPGINISSDYGGVLFKVNSSSRGQVKLHYSVMEILSYEAHKNKYGESESYYPVRVSNMTVDYIRVNTEAIFNNRAKFQKSISVNGSINNAGAASHSGGTPAIFYGDTIYKSSSSSERYKKIVKEMTEEDILDCYNISPVIAMYKPEYLSESDERYGKSFPMFIAENVEKYAPLAVDHNEKGQSENWNYKVIIPIMFQMIKSQKENIDSLIKRIGKLESVMGLEDGYEQN